MRWAAALVLLAGCRQIFGLRELPAPGDGARDAALGDGSTGDSAVADAYPDAPAGFVRIGGMVTGLATPATLVLRDNGSDDLTLHANGTFQFATPIGTGLAYAVTISTPPRDQQCTVTNGSGTVTSMDVTSVTISCVAQLQIDCGANICVPSAPTNLLCCVQPSGLHCLSNQNSSCSTDVPVQCDDARECPGHFCCAAFDSTNTLVISSCSSGINDACSAPPGGGLKFFCDPDDVAGSCPAGFTQCVPTTLQGTPPGYYQCAP